LSFEIQPDEGDAKTCTLTETARFKPRGLMGLAYWYTVLPLHGIVFDGMLKGIRRAAEQMAGSRDLPPSSKPAGLRDPPDPNSSREDW
jgi:hypothetical protein